MSLAEKTCIPCRGGVPPLQGEALDKLQAQVAGWQVVDGHHLWKAYTFPDFRQPWTLSTRRAQLPKLKGTIPTCSCHGVRSR